MKEKTMHSVAVSDGRTAKFWETGKDLNDFILALDLDLHAKRQLAMMICDHIEEAERGAFALGVSYIFGDNFEEVEA